MQIRSEFSLFGLSFHSAYYVAINYKGADIRTSGFFDKLLDNHTGF